MEERMDQLVNLDFGGRGIEHLYHAARDKVGKSLVKAAAEKLAAVPRGATVLITTGSASRAWISSTVVENDGPAGAAAVARALSLALDVIPVILVERALFGPVGGIFQAAGMCMITMEEARRTAMPGGRLSVAVLHDYPTDDAEGAAQAGPLLDELQPSLLFATERPGRNVKQIYHSSRGVDYGQDKARIDYIFDEANRRGIPTIGVGDGGNEIGMGLIAEAIRQHVDYGERCACGCGAGVGAVTSADVLVTAAVSNWGCYAVTASFAALLKNPDLLHTSEQEEVLLMRGAELGLINSPLGRVDPNVDAIPLASHKAVVELLREMAMRQMAK